MRPGVLETNKLADTQSPTDATGLYSFMDLAVLVLQVSLVGFPYRQDMQMVKGRSDKIFGSTPLVDMS